MLETGRCEFCGGLVQTKHGLVTKRLNKDVIEYLHLKPILHTKKYRCPLGCTAKPSTAQAANNIIQNGGAGTICMQNPHYRQRVENGKVY